MALIYSSHVDRLAATQVEGLTLDNTSPKTNLRGFGMVRSEGGGNLRQPLPIRFWKNLFSLSPTEVPCVSGTP